MTAALWGSGGRAGRGIAAGIVLVLLAAGAWTAWFLWGGNVAAVDPGRVYRSGQLDRPRLARLIAERHLAAVVNLRGENRDRPWYRDELRACAEAGIVHYDVAMGARERPAPQTVTRLLEIFRRGPYPLLIHCNRGADRTGLAAAIYLLDRRGATPDEASRQLSLLRGHFPARGYQRLDEFLALYRASWPAPLDEWTVVEYPRRR